METPVPPAKAAFIRALAEFLSTDLARKSIDIQLGKAGAQEWAKLRSTTPLFGYQSVDEAVAVLTTFLC